MNLLLHVALPCAVFLTALWFTGWLRRYALTRQRLLDVPNARSSHEVATPRGGGLAIALATLAALPVLGWSGVLAWSAVWALLGGGTIVALLGMLDDQGQVLAARWRLLGHVSAAIWVLAWMRGLPPLPILGVIRDVGPAGNALAVLYIVWMINLTNFMDGIDGLASIEAVTVCLGGVLLYVASVPASTPWLALIVLISATLGFLVWNWPPARIFMGDSGSLFLGFMLAAFSLQAAAAAPALFWSWVILLGVFIVDATITLARRAARGERVYEGHRSHAYQHAAMRRGAHRRVTLAVGAINLCWLLPIALLVARGSLVGLLGVLIAYVPLVGGAIWLRAGK